MRIVAVMSMRNEADVIESWVRYYAKEIDHIIITDNLSVDSSGDILQKLIAEGLPVTVEIDNRSGHLQQERMQKMMRRAYSEFEADWVLLLDADEFLIPPEGKTLQETLNELDNDRPVQVPWKTYIPTESDSEEPNVLKRICHRMESEVIQFFKVMVPAKVGKKPKAIIKMGNHDMRMGRRTVKAQEAPSGLFLAHFPVRSKEQIATKVIVGWLTTLARPKHNGGDNYHWKLLYNNFFDNGEEAFGDLEEVAINYLGSSEEKKDLLKVINDSIEGRLSDFTIKYPMDSKNNPIEVFAKTAEDIALKCGKLDTKLMKIESNPWSAFINLIVAILGVFRPKQ